MGPLVSILPIWRLMLADYSNLGAAKHRNIAVVVNVNHRDFSSLDAPGQKLVR